MSEPIETPENPDVLREVDVAGAYYLRTWNTNKRFETGQWKIGYEFTTHKRIEAGHGPLFCAEDYGCAPSQAVDSDECLLGLLAFLCLKPGDTDPDYFADYTEDQMDWAESSECESLACDVSCYEEHNDDGVPQPNRPLDFFADYAPED